MLPPHKLPSSVPKRTCTYCFTYTAICRCENLRVHYILATKSNNYSVIRLNHSRRIIQNFECSKFSFLTYSIFEYSEKSIFEFSIIRIFEAPIIQIRHPNI
ncbi:hypothetical protein Y032_0654g1190 [Ancylostoma ceylanicum]|uniref:Uncharacterized protein n=1 Tax=Ancylostoma ceylanicum TaxID=53326 RepID=A0A016WKD4_9BILA|nr:hypothetical protein Y032_0654g1190 [Ancylostoma ceylanicum]